MPPFLMLATALLVGGSTAASCAAAADWLVAHGLPQLTVAGGTAGAAIVEIDLPEVAEGPGGKAAGGGGPGLVGRRVLLVEEGVWGLCVKHLDEDGNAGRVRIRLDDGCNTAISGPKSVWRAVEALDLEAKES